MPAEARPAPDLARDPPSGEEEGDERHQQRVGTATDVTVSELVIESFFPADAATAEALRQFVDSL